MNHGETITTGDKQDRQGDACEHQPADGTLYTTTGLQASLRRRDDYPIDAVCAKCSRPIRCEQYKASCPGGDWQLKYELDERFAAFRASHPEVNVSDDRQSASWFDDDGAHQVSYDSPERMIGYLDARFGR